MIQFGISKISKLFFGFIEEFLRIFSIDKSNKIVLIEIAL